MNSHKALSKGRPTTILIIYDNDPNLAKIGRASLVLILRDVTRFTPLLARLVQ